MNHQDWKADLEQLRQELPQRHKNFYHTCRPEDFHSRLDSLGAELEQLNPYQIVMRMAGAVAVARDAHTALMVPQVERLPIDIYPFREGLYITAADAQHSSLLHGRVISIGGISAGGLTERFAEMIAHENRQFLLSCLPAMVPCTDILYGLGLMETPDMAELVVELPGQGAQPVCLSPLRYAGYHPAAAAPDEDLPLYRRYPAKNYWYTAERGMLYVNYRSCREMEGQSMREFCDVLKKELAENPHISRLVIDLRQNTGGDSELFKPFLVWLSENDTWNQPQKLKVIVGRDTFSSALLAVYFLYYHTRAVFGGEPTGGKPSSYGEVQYLRLKNTGLAVRYSTEFYDLADEDEPAFIPQNLFEVTFADWLSGKDPCVEWALSD